MSFASPAFLWYFLPATLALIWLSPRRWRNAVVAGASLLFYAWGAGASVLILIASLTLAYASGRAIARALEGGRPTGGLVVIGVGSQLSILAIWKYAGFASAQIDRLVGLLGDGSSPVVRIALPVGISFFTFQSISYIVDVARGTAPAQTRIVPFCTYLAMFPQLVAGPIVRYHELAHQLDEESGSRFDDLARGFPRFALGLCKKVVIADTIAPVADAAFADPASLVAATAWIGLITYAVQIFFDFSGYSDMAIGLGRMIGFRIPENFDRPYSASSVTDFWRRWHLSLSRWFRDYLYIPLGGNRASEARVRMNLVVVFLLTGLWHGAKWTFVAWGIWHGAALLIERATGRRNRSGFVSRVQTMAIVVGGWVIFRADSMADAAAYGRALVRPGGIGGVVEDALSDQRLLILALASTVFVLPARRTVGVMLSESASPIAAGARVGLSTVGAAYAGVVVAAGTFSPFLYFQF